jgi:nucleoside-diphosphate-sugar epimerase
MKILVTGGAGFIGSALTARLAQAGHEVRVLDDMSRGDPERLRGVRCTVFHGDVRNADDVLTAMHGCDAVAHLAYLQGTQTFYAEPRAVLDVALRGILNILRGCEVTGCSELLLASSSEAYQVAAEVPTPETVPLSVPDPMNARYSYGGGKIASELAALAWQRAGVLDRVVIARPHNIYGPDMGREHVIPEFCLRMNRLAESQPKGIIDFPIQGTGTETRSFCFIDDCTDQLALLLAHGHTGIWNVGTMDEHTIEDVAHAVAYQYGRQVKVLPGRLPQGSPPRRLPAMAKTRDLAGAQLAVTPWDQGLAATAAWYRERG